jgi:4'-phosphopantetheinyl transferase
MVSNVETAEFYVTTELAETLLWPRPPESLELRCRDVHVWKIVLHRIEEMRFVMFDLLSGDERKRAARYRFERDRVRFILRRGVLRTILGVYLRRAPQDLCFEYNSYGKPRLSEADNAAIDFNASSSGDVALAAIAREREVGVDVERIDPRCPIHKIAKRFFSRREIDEMDGLPNSAQREAFFRAWTCKEAYIKARGQGLSIPLADFDVRVDPSEPPRLQAVRNGPDYASAWTLRDLDAAEGCAAALSIGAGSMNVQRYEWSA